MKRNKYHPLVNKVMDTIDREQLLIQSKTKGNLVLGLSGGPDSVFLLECLAQLQDRYNIRLTAVHINHCLRSEGKKDAELARKLAGERGVSFVSYTYPIIWMAKTYKISVEEAGRMARYETFRQELMWLEKTKKTQVKGMIATGHHLNDSQETIVFNLIRGTGLSGLTGIPIQRDNIIRPLLECSKQEIIAYLNEHRIEYAVDETNDLSMYNRNKIRHEIMPVFKEINPNVENNLEQMSDILRMDNEYIEAMAKQVYDETVYRRELAFYISQNLHTYHQAIKSRVIKELLQQAKSPEIRKIHLDDILGLFLKETGKQIHLPGLLAIKITTGILLSVPLVETKPICYELIENNWLYMRENNLYIWYNSYHDKNKDDQNFNKQSVIADRKTYLSTIYLPEPREITVRNRQIGDKVSTWGGSKSLSAFLIDEKIPFYKRDELLFIAHKNDILFMLNNHELNQKLKTNQIEKTICYLEIWEGI